VPTVSVNGVQIAYVTAGSGSSTVCFVHGTGGSSQVWTRQFEGLADLGHIMALDLPGHGGSGGRIPKGIDEAAAVVGEFLDALGIARVVIGGHSMGGAIAQQFALSYPERVSGLVLIGTGARLRVLPRLLDLLATDYPRGVDLLMSLAVSTKAPAELKTALHRSTADNAAGVVLGDLQACDRFDVMSRISTVAAPTLVICGEEDQLTPPKYARFLGERIAAAAVTVIAGAGHYVQVEKPRETTAAIREFLARLGRGAGSPDQVIGGSGTGPPTE
jgi:pimeloyl-ACP methyl ester carboxylesterase